MDKSRKKIAQDYSRNAIADSRSSKKSIKKDGKYEAKMAVKEAAGEGPSMYGKSKGPKMGAGLKKPTLKKMEKDGKIKKGTKGDSKKVVFVQPPKSKKPTLKKMAEDGKLKEGKKGDSKRVFGKSKGPKMMGAKKGDQSKSRADYAMDSGKTDKGYKGKTGSSKGDQSATKKDYAKPVAAMHGKTHGGAKMYDKGPNMESAAQEKSDLMKMPGGYKVMGDNGPKMYGDSPMQMKGSWMSKHTKSRM